MHTCHLGCSFPATRHGVIGYLSLARSIRVTVLKADVRRQVQEARLALELLILRLPLLRLFYGALNRCVFLSVGHPRVPAWRFVGADNAVIRTKWLGAAMPHSSLAIVMLPD